MHKKINTYYLHHLSGMPFDKQFHYASRLWLWTGDEQYASLLKKLRPQFAQDLQLESIDTLMGEMLASQSPEFGSKNAATERALYFARYPLLRQALPLLFRLLFIKTVYGVDARPTLANHFDLTQLEALAQELEADTEATAMLSTHASNFLYLWHRFYKEDAGAIDLPKLYEIGKTAYDHSNRTHLQLLIYLYTHCIIGESLFYKCMLPAENKQLYLKMCEDLEQLIGNNFEHINLDNKCEFLVVCKIAGYKSNLHQRIWDEAERSFSDEGDFIIDRHNQNPQTDNISLEKSEHRNVLLIMSFLDFRPSNKTVL